MVEEKKTALSQKAKTAKNLKLSELDGVILPLNPSNSAVMPKGSLNLSEVILRSKTLDDEAYKGAQKAFFKAVADQVNGLTMDQSKAVVRAIRGALNDEQRPKAPYEVDPTPWPEDVQIIDVIRDIEDMVARVMVMRPEYITAVAYYCLASWFVEYLDYSPYLVITAPDRECGKSKLLNLIGKLVRRPYSMAGAPSDSSVFRIIEQNTPTLLMDEVDTYLSKSKELQGILNGGIDRENAFVTRSEGTSSADMRAVRFSTFGFKVLSGIGSDKSGDALVSRAIIVKLDRKKATDKRIRVRELPPLELENLRRKMYRLVCAYGEGLKEKARGARVDMPLTMGDRDCDKWEAQALLADMVSAEEGARLRDVAEKISCVKGEPSWKTVLLADVYDVVLNASHPDGLRIDDIGLTIRLGNDATHGDYITSRALNDALILNKEKRWGTFSGGRAPISQNLMSRTLTEFGVVRVKIKKEGNKSAFPVRGIIDAVMTYAPNVEGD